MSNGGPRGARLDIIERPSTIILRQTESITAVAGGTAQSAGVGPAAGVRWLIHAVSVQAQFVSVPVATDGGVASGIVINTGNIFFMTGVETEPIFGIMAIRRGRGYPLLMELGDVFHAFADARNSTSNVFAQASLLGVQYSVIGP